MSDTQSAGPPRRRLGLLVLAILLLHLVLLTAVQSPLSVKLRTDPPSSALQTRVVALETPAPVKAPVRQVTARQSLAAAAAPEAPSKVADPIIETGSQAVPEAAQQGPTVPEPQPPVAPVREEVATPAPPQVQEPSSTAAWPVISPGAIPPSRLLHYRLTGMDRGIDYQASGELRWQHNETDYELTLSVRAFLVGRRQWRSVGRIDDTGLAPVRFSDTWRNERAAHFDRSQQRVVFSSNSTPAPLEPGAQDQISLYVQLAAAMAGGPERFAPGARLQVQTVTVRDAQPWSLVLEGIETMTIEGQGLKVLKWVCQPRNRYEARVEFWVAAEQAWLPMRIRITQASGSFIDLVWRSSEPLAPLPVQAEAKLGSAGS